MLVSRCSPRGYCLTVPFPLFFGLLAFSDLIWLKMKFTGPFKDLLMIKLFGRSSTQCLPEHILFWSTSNTNREKQKGENGNRSVSCSAPGNAVYLGITERTSYEKGIKSLWEVPACTKKSRQRVKCSSAGAACLIHFIPFSLWDKRTQWITTWSLA